MYPKRNEAVFAADDGKGGAAAVDAGKGADAGAAAAAAAVAAAGAAKDGDKSVLATGADGAVAGADKGAGADAGAVKATFPDNWREQLAGDDKKWLEELKRYGSYRDYANAGRALRGKLSAGELRAPFPDKGTDEEKATWRQQNGQPDKAEALLVDLDLPNGITIGEEDKPLATDFATRMFAVGASKSVVAAGMQFYYANQTAVAKEMKALDDAQHTRCLDELNGEWGKDFRTNSSIAFGVLDLGAAEKKEGDNVVKASLKDRILGARLADGTLLGDDPDALRWLQTMGRMANVDATIIPNAGGGGVDVETELAALRKDMNTDINAWHKDKTKQARYQELLGYQEAINKRKAKVA